MKKVLVGLTAVFVLIVGGGVYIYLNLDSIVKSAIETTGTRALGTDVAVDRVELNLPAGTAAIYGFSIANPQGYTDGEMISFEELSVGLDVQNISGESIHITSVVSRSPFVHYESIDGVTNFDTIAARFDSGEPAATAADESAQPRLIVDTIDIENIRGTVTSDRLPAPVDVNLGDIHLANLDGYPADLASQVMAPVIAQLGTRAAEALLRAYADILGDSNSLQESLDNVKDRASEALDRVGDIFRRDDN